jgi:hypothetical protein
VGVVIDVVIVGLIALWGVLCGKGLRWAFWTGMALYLIDGLIELGFKMWISSAFHLYVIYNLYQGLAAANLLRKLEAAVAEQARSMAARPIYAQQPGPSQGWSPQGGAPPADSTAPAWRPGFNASDQADPNDPSA